ncbi:MAG TPA: maltose alpha-D-glucosyltransferase [Dehalococcoidia bacterium]|nr:maltose alpha-D-glucosyltransferase [Dehalococcoidia bacterium]
MVGRRSQDLPLTDDPLWYKDAVIYEVHVRAFYDSNDDGIGDFRGLTEKLDYLQDLGVTAIWLLPFYPSPLLDDGYDIADYNAVHPAYGTLRDARDFIRQAHRRGLRVITELVCNHTSDQHPWFQRARRAPRDSNARNFYVWSDSADRYREARIIFKDFETSNWTWDPIAGQYYWHRFYRHQPDLNFENPRVHRAILDAMDGWLDLGVDGLRLDAVPYLYEAEGTNCENLPQTYEFLRKLRAHVDGKYANRMLLAEANQWPEDAVAYFGQGDMCNMAFHFPLMPRMFMAIHMEDRFPIIDILRQTPAIPDNCQWALFLRNHDELTLEMVTDEERDYMYRVYAVEQQMRINLGIRRRLAPLLGNHRRRIELMNGLLFSLPGTPVIYYGDEIGMGDNVYLGDRNAGFSRANPQKLYLPIIIDPEYHYETVNVQAQRDNPHSLLWWTKRLIALRKRYKAFGRGTLEFLQPDNRKVLAFVRAYEDERILVVANLSRFVQGVELDLSAHRGLVPVEMFGRVEFPPVGDKPYFITLGPHSFYWFSLEQVRQRAPQIRVEPEFVPSLSAANWQSSLQEQPDRDVSLALSDFLIKQRWFGGKAQGIRSVSVCERTPLRAGDADAVLSLIEVQYSDGGADMYQVPIAAAYGDQAKRVERDWPDAVIARLRGGEPSREGVLYDGLFNEDVAEALLALIANNRRLRGERGDIMGSRTRLFRQLAGTADVGSLKATAVKTEQSNSAISFGDRLFFKLFRRVEPGVNPDLEISRYLTDSGFPNAPRLAGAIEYVQGRIEPRTLAVLYEFVPNEGDAWSYTRDTLKDFFERALASQVKADDIRITAGSLLDLAEQPASPQALEMVGPYLEAARLLGQRTAELHTLLAAATEPSLAPETFTSYNQRSLYQSLRNLTSNTMRLLARRVREDGESVPPEALRVLALEDRILQSFGRLLEVSLEGLRIRVHGDFHLGQVLFKGNDFVIIDFEGEPARPVTERRLRRTPLRDVAGILRSFNYAVHDVLIEEEATGLRDRGGSRLDVWARFWSASVSAAYLRGYLQVARPAGLVPADRGQLEMLLGVCLLEKAVYEIGYELNNRPDWVVIPLRGVLELLGAEG